MVEILLAWRERGHIFLHVSLPCGLEGIPISWIAVAVSLFRNDSDPIFTFGIGWWFLRSLVKFRICSVRFLLQEERQIIKTKKDLWRTPITPKTLWPWGTYYPTRAHWSVDQIDSPLLGKPVSKICGPPYLMDFCASNTFRRISIALQKWALQ